ncbi:MAG: hypothetical protein ACKVU1_09045 [bacterium]
MVLESGICDSGGEAVAAALNAVPKGTPVACAAIDGPLVWSRSGSRRCDQALRRAIAVRGAPSPGGTVQEVNSLRGACLAQAVLAASAIREELPGLPITEAHPKVLLFLLEHAILAGMLRLREHARDAALATISGWASIHQPSGWSDLYRDERNLYHLIDAPVSYWMPVRMEPLSRHPRSR